jgi:hypothetical protein
LLKPEKLLAFSDQKRWIFLPGIGSPGKVGNTYVGSIPIDSTNILNGLWVTDRLEASQL